MSEEMKEYVTFHVTAGDGRDVEMAVIEEFEYDRKLYVAGAVVENDTVSDDGCYIYRCILTEDGFRAEPVTDPVLFREVSEAYQALE